MKFLILHLLTLLFSIFQWRPQVLDFGGAASRVAAFAGGTVHDTGTEGLRKTIQSAQFDVFLAQAVKCNDGYVEDSVPCLTGNALSVCLPSFLDFCPSFSLLLYCFSRVRIECFIACSCVKNLDKWSCCPFLNLFAIISLSRVSKLVFLKYEERKTNKMQQLDVYC